MVPPFTRLSKLFDGNEDVAVQLISGH